MKDSRIQTLRAASALCKMCELPSDPPMFPVEIARDRALAILCDLAADQLESSRQIETESKASEHGRSQSPRVAEPGGPSGSDGQLSEYMRPNDSRRQPPLSERDSGWKAAIDSAIDAVLAMPEGSKLYPDLLQRHSVKARHMEELPETRPACPHCGNCFRDYGYQCPLVDELIPTHCPMQMPVSRKPVPSSPAGESDE